MSYQATRGEIITDLELAQQQSAARAEHILELIEQVVHLEADKRELQRQLSAALAACQACREEREG